MRTFIVTKQLMDNLVISAEAGDMRQMAGFDVVMRRFISSRTSPAALLPSPIKAMSGLSVPFMMSP